MLPLVVRIEDLETRESTVYRFEISPVQVGRNALNQLYLKEGFVSQWHGIFVFDDVATKYVDLGSTNGSELNGAPLTPNVETPVGPDVDLRIGQLRLHVSRDAAIEVQRPREKTAFERNADSLLDEVRKQLNHLITGEAPVPVSGPAPVGATGPSAELWGRLGRLTDQFRASWRELLRELEEALRGLSRAQRAAFLEDAARRFPALAAEREFQDLLRREGAKLPGVGSPQPPGAVSLAPSGGAVSPEILELLRLFARTYVGRSATVATADDVRTLLGRLSATLETFARAFVELRRGQEHFASEMGVRPAGGADPLARAKDASEVLSYLFNLSVDTGPRLQELNRGFGDLMTHQLALLHGVRAGLRALLEELSPQKMATVLKGGVFDKLLPAAALYKRFAERHQELMEEEDQVQNIAFGPAFARAYASVAGQRSTPVDPTLPMTSELAAPSAGHRRRDGEPG